MRKVEYERITGAEVIDNGYYSSVVENKQRKTNAKGKGQVSSAVVAVCVTVGVLVGGTIACMADSNIPVDERSLQTVISEEEESTYLDEIFEFQNEEQLKNAYNSLLSKRVKTMELALEVLDETKDLELPDKSEEDMIIKLSGINNNVLEIIELYKTADLTEKERELVGRKIVLAKEYAESWLEESGLETAEELLMTTIKSTAAMATGTDPLDYDSWKISYESIDDLGHVNVFYTGKERTKVRHVETTNKFLLKAQNQIFEIQSGKATDLVETAKDALEITKLIVDSGTPVLSGEKLTMTNSEKEVNQLVKSKA